MLNRIIYILCGLAAFAIAGYMYMQMAATDKLFTQGPVATAQFEPASSQYTETRGRFGIKTYKTALGYTTGSGQKVVVRDAYISKEELQQFQAGQPITREYLVNDPQTTREPGKTEPKWPALIAVVVGIVLLITGWGSGRKEDEAEASDNTPSGNT